MTQRASAARSLPEAPSGDSGSSAVEYGLVVFALAGVIAAVVFAFGGFVNETFGGATNCLETHTPHPECTTPDSGSRELPPP
jgi:pilus assembly protein Flp/PilA